MNKNIQDTINAIAADIQAMVEVIMQSADTGNNKPSVKELKDKFRKDDVIVKASNISGSSPAIIEIFYDSYLEWERKPQTGLWPSVSDIRDWAQSKGIATDNSTINLIRRSIWWHGHAGQSILDALDKEIDRMLEHEWSDRIFEAITAEIEEWLEK